VPSTCVAGRLRPIYRYPSHRCEVYFRHALAFGQEPHCNGGFYAGPAARQAGAKIEPHQN
jgi:hypothetical protein